MADKITGKAKPKTKQKRASKSQRKHVRRMKQAAAKAS